MVKQQWRSTAIQECQIHRSSGVFKHLIAIVARNRSLAGQRNADHALILIDHLAGCALCPYLYFGYVEFALLQVFYHNFITHLLCLPQFRVELESF